MLAKITRPEIPGFQKLQAAKTVPGVWGPVYGTVMPNFWLIEAGQNAVGRVFDEVQKNFKK